MGSNELRLRDNWQTFSGELSAIAEQDVLSVFNILFKKTDYRIIKEPKDFLHVYEKWPLSSYEKKQIYNPDKPYKHGFRPDYAIENIKTKKTIYLEVKRQDGWVEGKEPSAGRGNAHERLCKYFTPGLMKILSEKSKIAGSLPFWVVFVGDITRDPKRVREITCWFDKFTDHFLFWRNNDHNALCNHFIKRITPLLD
ncbi:MAG: MunI family type II restriction endonuclease [Flavobacteriaceae bacterium]|nr:MunI family type II restriction endonuclease [Flavobacteriaceae bacterium]